MPSYNFAVLTHVNTPKFASMWFLDTARAERYARAQCAIDGQTRLIQNLTNGSNGQIVAEVRMDAFGRVWTDVCQMQDALL